MNIGSLKLKNPFLLAPMLEPNDIAFRLLCKKCGCGLTYTGMTSPLTKQKIILDDKPALQLFGNSARGISSFIKKYDKKVSLWDFNLGCPSKLSKKSNHGAFIQHELEKIEKILIAMKKATKKPISIKIRKSPYAFSLAKMAEKYVDAIAVHPRTISQGYSGEPDYKFALKIRDCVSIPIIYSGNVNEKNVGKILKDFPFVFMGRETIGRPEIFAKLTGKKVNINFSDYLKLAEKNNLFFRQIKFQAMNFTKGIPNSKKIRKEIVKTKNIEELKNLNSLFSFY